jgi:serine/threonine-protein kinase
VTVVIILKPSNVMIETDDAGRRHPVIMDFGIARETGANTGLTEAGLVMGTPGYMSPEQARGEVGQVDRRADVYS